MAATLPPGIGNPQQALQATAFLRTQPWYQQRIRSWGLNPAGDANGNVRLSDQQREQLLNEARQRGIGISDRYEIDENGQIAEQPSHLLRNIGIGAGIAGLALTGFGAAGIGPLAGAFGGAGAAAGGAAAVEGAGLGTAAAGAGTAAGLGTGAGVAGTAAAGAGWFSPSLIIPSAVQGIASIYGNAQQANATKEAAQLQYQSTEEALADARAQRQYAQGQYANYLGRLSPYLSLGTTAGSTLQNLMARSPYTKLANNGPLPQYSTAPRSVGSGQTPAAAQSVPQGPGSQAMVTLRAPNGSEKAVAANEVDHWTKLGAVPV